MTENEANMNIKYAVCVLESIGNGLTLKNENDKENACVLAIQAIDKVQQFEAIGTIEELKDLKEKSVAKKPIVKGLMAIDDRRYYCPKCNERLYREHFDVGYCNCGQSIRT